MTRSESLPNAEGGVAAGVGRSDPWFRLLFERSSDAIFIVTLDAGEIFRIIDANHAAAVMHGCTIDDLRGRPLDADSAAEERDQVIRGAYAAYAGGAVRREGVRVRRDGTRFVADISVDSAVVGGRRYNVAFLRDITERRGREDALRAAEERYRVLFERATDGIFILGADAEGVYRVLDINQAAADLYGAPADVLRGRPAGETLIHDLSRGDDALLGGLISGSAPRCEIRRVRRDGTTITLDISSARAEIGGRAVIIGFARDVSAERRAEEALREAKEAAEAANRAKSAFLASMSHEIRTPLNAILGYTQLLLGDPALSDDQRRYLQTIDRGGDHLLAMINDVLEMSKIEAGFRQLNPAPFDLPALCEDLCRMFKLRAEDKGIRFRVEAPPGLPRQVLADEGKLRQALVNLTGNAVKFTERGEVTVRVVVRAEPNGGARLDVEVEDSGPGISEDEQRRLFQPFVQARGGSARGGTGLGLSLSRELVRLMGGDITVESRVGEGSRFRFSIPVVASAVEESPRRAHRVVGVVVEDPPPRVLVVDDDDDSRSWLRVFLQRLGFEVREAENGREAFDLAILLSPRLIFMDLDMPVMDGYASMRAIRARMTGNEVALVALTASAFDDAGPAIFAAGADEWLRKPCREDALLEVMERRLGLRFRRISEPAEVPVGEALPPALRDPILHAARLADYQRLQDLVAALPAEYAGWAGALRGMIDRFAYEEITARLSA